MNTRRITIQLLIALAVLSGSMFSATVVRADDEQQPAVARISLIHGDVSTQRGDSGEWTAVTVNTPVVAGDRISTGQRSRAEVQLDYGNILRLDERADVTIADLSRTHIQLQVHEGLVNVSVAKGSDADVQIDTSNGAVRPAAGEGSYRILVIQDETRLIVRKGEAEVTTPQGSTRVQNNQEITIHGTDDPEFRITEAPGRDDWDNFNRDRDHQVRDAQSWQHTNRYYSGTEDLDRSGRWVYVPGYGQVWQPAVSADWAPYRDGRWVWEPYYGYTWVSYEPWGWAPYHYGRWFYYGNSWSWWPGPVEAAYYPIWAPAYVSFFGFGFGHHSGFGFGVGFGSIGWLPLGPSDFCRPWWGRGFGRGNNINITNITNITNVRGGLREIGPLATGNRPAFSNLNGVMNNPRLQRGITAMPSDKFGRAAVTHNAERVTVAALRQGGTSGSLPGPTRESFRPVDRAANPTTVHNNGGQPERFFSKSQATSTPQSSPAQTPQVRQGTPQRQTSAENRAAARTAVQSRAPSAAPVRPSAQPFQNSGGGWQKFSGPPRQATPDRSAPQPWQSNRDTGRPTVSSPAPAQRLPSTSSNPGWQRFTPRSDSRPSSSADRPSGSSRPPVMERQQQRNYHPSQDTGSSRTYEPQRNYTPQRSYQPQQSESRPALDLHRQIVSPRSSSSYGGSYGGASRGGGSSSGRSSAPSGGSRGSSGRSSQGSSSGGSSHPQHGSGPHGRG